MPTSAVKVGVVVKVACVDEKDIVKIPLIVESTYAAGVCDLMKLQVSAPHDSVAAEPETLSYHRLADELPKLPIAAKTSLKLVI